MTNLETPGWRGVYKTPLAFNLLDSRKKKTEIHHVSWMLASRIYYTLHAYWQRGIGNLNLETSRRRAKGGFEKRTNEQTCCHNPLLSQQPSSIHKRLSQYKSTPSKTTVPKAKRTSTQRGAPGKNKSYISHALAYFACNRRRHEVEGVFIEIHPISLLDYQFPKTRWERSVYKTHLWFNLWIAGRKDAMLAELIVDLCLSHASRTSTSFSLEIGGLDLTKFMGRCKVRRMDE